MGRRLAAILLVAVAAATAASTAGASSRLKIGIYEEALTLGNPDVGFAYLQELRPQVLRLNLTWHRVAATRPADPSNPLDPAYNWDSYDQAIQRASAIGVEVLLHVIGTPAWANGGRAPQYAPTSLADLRAFALAAARRYPMVSKWAAWNEPNLANYLRPTWRRIRGRLQPVGARTYARICTTIWRAVHQAAAEAVRPVKVACGVTAPYARGGSGISPIRFLREMKRAKARFDVYAHHPYSRHPSISPSTIPPNRQKTVSLGNIGDLMRELTRLYGKKKLWITEYGYQTNPPERWLGVPLERQALYASAAALRAYQAPLVDMLIHFMVQDDGRPAGWQSGLRKLNGAPKPAYNAFKVPLAQVSRRGARTVVWGQVRPRTGRQPYRLQQWRSGGWRWVGSRRFTGPRGFFQRTLRAPKGSKLRVWSPQDGVFSPPFAVR